MSYFITNSGTKKFSDRLKELINESKELKFLVGFFYFSGIREIYHSLKKNKDVVLKILVGLDTDILKCNFVDIPFEYKDIIPSNEEIINKYFNSIKKLLNEDIFDNQEFYEQVRFFIKMIQEDRLIIRKTIKPNHSKLYIFKFENIVRQTVYITGSSNLTRPGLTSRLEFNIELSDFGSEEAEKYFDELWQESVEITEDKNLKKILIKILEEDTLIKTITPFEAYVFVLKSYIETFEQKSINKRIEDILIKNGYKIYEYQIDAIKGALSIIDKYNGVIIADVVGLGKTIIACAVARQLDKKGIILCPPGLIGDHKKNEPGWDLYKEQFELYNWEVFSSGNLDNALEFVNRKEERDDKIEVVIIDEAHRFRNTNTKTFETLKNICRNKIVILLTATPFNNKPSDIFALLSLFIIPKKSALTLENNLYEKFREFGRLFDKLAYIKRYIDSPIKERRERAEAFYSTYFDDENISTEEKLKKVKKKVHDLSKKIRSVIEPVIIRRNRLDIQKNPYYSSEVGKLSKVDDPKEWYYELTEEQSRFYDEIITKFFNNPEYGGQFKGAIYRPYEYETILDEDIINEDTNFTYVSQRNLYDLMRRNLIKRFESSFGAFKKSIENFKQIYEKVLLFIEKTGKGDLYKGKFVYNRKFMESVYNLDEEEIEKQLIEYEKQLEELIKDDKSIKKNYDKVYNISKFMRKKEFIQDIKDDIKMFDEILKKLDEYKMIENDPKIKSIIPKIKETLQIKNPKEPKRKIVIFSEYVATVNYIAEKLNKEFGNKVLVVSGNLSSTKVKEINKNFDASVDPKLQEDKYDILLTSDKLSEGYNLNRAGMIINYDIPWNPVRVIQRLGRINRISKKVFNKLYIVNFFPTEKGAEQVRIREIAKNKMFMIHNTLGEDAKIFDIDEDPSPANLFIKLQQNPDLFEEESTYTKIINEYEEIKNKYPEIIEKIKCFPKRLKTAKFYNENELIVFYKKGKLFAISVKENEKKKLEVNEIDLNDAIKKIKCDINTNLVEWNNKYFWEAYKKAKKLAMKKDNIILNKTTAREKSAEKAAFNVINTLLKYQQLKEFEPIFNFLKDLKEDIQNYGTLTDYTYRRIINIWDKSKKIKKNIKNKNINSNLQNINFDVETIIEEFSKLKKEFGENYLEKEKKRIKYLNKEVIVAIENKIDNNQR